MNVFNLMTTIELIKEYVLSAYPEECQAENILLLDTVPPLSSCRHWLIQTSQEKYCLRCWPKGTPKREQLEFQQAVLWHSVCEGIDFVPLPIETKTHQGIVSYEGSFWELLPWFDSNEKISNEYFSPGGFPCVDEDGNYLEANSNDSSDHWQQNEIRSFEIASALMSLAQFHLAVSSFPLPHFPISVSPKVRDQLAKWEQWIGGRFVRLYDSLIQTRSDKNAKVMSCLADAGLTLLDHALPYAGRTVTQLSQAARLSIPIQAVVGNCCRRHLRFDEEGLCGMIDFKEISVDSVAWDIATLLGSMTESDTNLWTLGIKAYQSVRPLTDNEKSLVYAFELSPFFIKGLNFLSQAFLAENPYNEEQLGEIERRVCDWNRLFENESRNRRSA